MTIEPDARSEVEATEASSNERIVLAVLGVVILTLVGGFLLKAQCLEPWDGRQYSNLCYNDIQPLFGEREILLGTFPYIGGDRSEGGVSGGSIEYPVLTGLFMWMTGLF